MEGRCACGYRFDGSGQSVGCNVGRTLVVDAPLQRALIVIVGPHGSVDGGLFTDFEGQSCGTQRGAFRPHLGLRPGDSDGALGGDNIRTGYKSEDLYLCCSGGYGRDGERCRPDAIGRINSRNTPIQTLDSVTGG